MAKFAPFDAADYLNDEETIAEYISAALDDPNPDVFLTAVRDVARARGMAPLAKDAGLSRESLYKALTQSMTVLEAIARGEQAIAEGRVATHAQARTRLARWLE